MWGCESYITIPKTYRRKDFRDKCRLFDGILRRRSDGVQDICPDLKEIIVGVNCLFNEVIPSYREEYFQDLSKLQFKMAKGKSTVKSLEHFVGIRYQDDELLLEFVTIRVVILQGVIVAYRAPVNKDGRVRFKEKSPIHTADVVRMIELSTSRLNNGESELSDERKIRSIFKAGIGHEASLASPTGSKKKVRFVLQELGREGQKRPRRGASALKQSNHHKRASTM